VPGPPPHTRLRLQPAPSRAPPTARPCGRVWMTSEQGAYACGRLGARPKGRDSERGRSHTPGKKKKKKNLRPSYCACATAPSHQVANGFAGSAPDDSAPAPWRPAATDSSSSSQAKGQRGDSPAAMKLTRKMVLSRAKASELHNVRKLNCW
jgi:hypothetical protein